MTLYDDLGLPPGADEDAIRAAWRRKAKETHPDANPEDERAPENFQRALAAYETLSDPRRRAHYDRTGDAGGGARSIEQRAEAAARAAFNRAIAEAAEGDDLFVDNIVDLARQSLRETAREMRNAALNAERQERRWLRLKARAKGALLEAAIDERVRVARNNAAAASGNIAVAEAALALIDDGYAHEPDPTPAQDSATLMRRLRLAAKTATLPAIAPASGEARFFEAGADLTSLFEAAAANPKGAGPGRAGEFRVSLMHDAVLSHYDGDLFLVGVGKELTVRVTGALAVYPAAGLRLHICSVAHSFGDHNPAARGQWGLR